MRIIGSVFLLAILFWPFSSVLAADPPVQLSPENGSTVTTSTLKWQTPSYPLYSTNPYRVQVDDDSTFSTPYRNYYTSNTQYTPTLSLGMWYWRVKARDSTNIWSAWSSTWQFTLTSQPTPSPSFSPSPSPSPSPTPSPTPSSSPSPSSSTIFTISNTPSTINSTQSFAVIANIKNFSPNSRYYLKGAFLKTNSSNYFGKTKVGGSWVKNSQSYSNQLPITTDPSGNFSGQIEAMVDPNDTGFTGTEEYLFKVARYTQEGSGPVWSNQATINIIHSEETDISSSTTTTSETLNSTSQNTTSQNSPQTTLKLPKNSSKPPKIYTLPKSITASSSSLAGVSVNYSTSQNSKYSPKTFFNPATLMAVSLIIMGGGLIAYYFTKR